MLNQHPTQMKVIAVNKNKGEKLTNLDDVWLAVTTKVNPPTIKALLSQQCRLISLDDSKAMIGIGSSRLMKLHEGKIPSIEAAFEVALGYSVTVELITEVDAAKKFQQVVQSRSKTNLTQAQQLALSRLKSFTESTDKFFRLTGASWHG